MTWADSGVCQTRLAFSLVHCDLCPTPWSEGVRVGVQGCPLAVPRFVAGVGKIDLAAGKAFPALTCSSLGSERPSATLIQPVFRLWHTSVPLGKRHQAWRRPNTLGWGIRPSGQQASLSRLHRLLPIVQGACQVARLIPGVTPVAGLQLPCPDKLGPLRWVIARARGDDGPSVWPAFVAGRAASH